jgi:hypothetical protein
MAQALAGRAWGRYMRLLQTQPFKTNVATATVVSLRACDERGRLHEPRMLASLLPAAAQLCCARPDPPNHARAQSELLILHPQRDFKYRLEA